ncbi:MAG: NADH-quinone oxidoreductase subunit A [Muribaculaceae bacterium]|nr:NADH-quinone oxidoreductase subunit A [Muribaculaceae bacterium]
MISTAIFGIENNGLLGVTALLTGVALVFLALWIAKLISPRSFNPQKGEAYECGIPTRGESMSQFKVGYYLFAILFLMFDVETVFLFPWAVRMNELGVNGLLSIAIFFGVLVLGLVYAWRKGALEWK